MSDKLFSEAMGELSDKYITEAINYNVEKEEKNVFYVVGRYAAVACILFVLCFGLLMSVSSEARAAVWGWVSEFYEENVYKIFFAGEAEETVGLKYELGWLPEGTEFVKAEHDGNVVTGTPSISGKIKESDSEEILITTDNSFINKLLPDGPNGNQGNLIVKKQVTVGSLKGKEFKFKVTLKGSFEYNGIQF